MADAVPVTLIRRATHDDWPTIWPIIAAVIASGDTYSLAPDAPEHVAHAYWMAEGNKTYVATQGDDFVNGASHRLREGLQGFGNRDVFVARSIRGHGATRRERCAAGEAFPSDRVPPARADRTRRRARE